MRITTYQQAFEGLLWVKLTDEAWRHIKLIEQDGYNERSIAYTVWRTQNKLNQFKRDPRFWNILHNEVRKHAFRKGTTNKPPLHQMMSNT